MRTRWLAIVSMASLLAWSAPVIAKDGRGHVTGHGSSQGKAKVEGSERGEEHKAKPAKHKGGRSRARGWRRLGRPCLRSRKRWLSSTGTVIDAS